MLFTDESVSIPSRFVATFAALSITTCGPMLGACAAVLTLLHPSLWQKVPNLWPRVRFHACIHNRHGRFGAGVRDKMPTNSTVHGILFYICVKQHTSVQRWISRTTGCERHLEEPRRPRKGHDQPACVMVSSAAEPETTDELARPPGHDNPESTSGPF